MYALLLSLLMPTAPKDKTFKEIKEAVRAETDSCAERYYFRRQLQALDEIITEYVTELHRLSSHCKFDGYLKEELCDLLDCGLRMFREADDLNF